MTQGITDKDRAFISEQVQIKLEEGLELFCQGTAKAMQWMLDFAQEDIESMSLSRWDDLAYEIESLVIHGITPQIERVNLYETKGWAVHVLDFVTVPTRKEALALQETIVGHLNALIEQGSTQIEMPPMTLGISTCPNCPNVQKPVLSAKSVHEVFRYYFARLLSLHSSLLRKCGDCSRFFLAIRRNQKYCSDRCQSRVSTAKYRGSKKAISASKKPKRKGKS